MSNDTTNTAVDTIVKTDTLSAIVDGVNTIGHGESAFEFTGDGFETTLRDASSVALIRQTIDADSDAFEHFDAPDEFVAGMNTEKLDSLLSNVDAESVRLAYDADDFVWVFEADTIDATIGPIRPDAIEGSPTGIPPIKDDMPYNVEVTMPFDAFEKAADVTGMVGEVATFVMGGDVGFRVETRGDTDTYGVDISESDTFEWLSDAPASPIETKHSIQYMANAASLLDAESGIVVTGDDLPYHLSTTREGHIDTKIVQAPRIAR